MRARDEAVPEIRGKCVGVLKGGRLLAKTNEQHNTKIGPVPHREAAEDFRREHNALKGDPQHVEKEELLIR